MIQLIGTQTPGCLYYFYTNNNKCKYDFTLKASQRKKVTFITIRNALPEWERFATSKFFKNIRCLNIVFLDNQSMLQIYDDLAKPKRENCKQGPLFTLFNI